MYSSQLRRCDITLGLASARVEESPHLSDGQKRFMTVELGAGRSAPVYATQLTTGWAIDGQLLAFEVSDLRHSGFEHVGTRFWFEFHHASSLYATLRVTVHSDGKVSYRTSRNPHNGRHHTKVNCTVDDFSTVLPLSVVLYFVRQIRRATDVQLAVIRSHSPSTQTQVSS